MGACFHGNFFAIYNPQNEMFLGFQTKSIFPQNEKSFWFLI